MGVVSGTPVSFGEVSAIMPCSVGAEDLVDQPLSSSSDRVLYSDTLFTRFPVKRVNVSFQERVSLPRKECAAPLSGVPWAVFPFP